MSISDPLGPPSVPLRFINTISTIPLQMRDCLVKYGIHTTRDLNRYDAQSLSKVIHLSPDDCRIILDSVTDLSKAPKAELLVDALRHEVSDNRFQKIKTGIEGLDAALKGGLPCGYVTEIYGEGGIGKTQLVMQLCVHVQTPRLAGGLQGHALFIDGENSFSTSRILSMAGDAIPRWKEDSRISLSERPMSMSQKELVQLDINHIMDRIHLIACKSSDHMKMVILHQLESFLSSHPLIRLIVIDGFSYHLRYGYEEDFEVRTKLIYLVANKLRTIAQERSICVVLTNQVTQKPEEDELVPALGRTWASTCSTKVMLHHKGNHRMASLVKSRLSPKCHFPYIIMEQGIMQQKI